MKTEAEVSRDLFPELLILKYSNFQASILSPYELEQIGTKLLNTLDNNPAELLSLHSKMPAFIVSLLKIKFEMNNAAGKFGYINVLRAGLIFRYLYLKHRTSFSDANSLLFATLFRMLSANAPMIELTKVANEAFYKNHYVLALEQINFIDALLHDYTQRSKHGHTSLHILDSNTIELVAINTCFSYIDFLSTLKNPQITDQQIKDQHLSIFIVSFPLLRKTSDCYNLLSKRTHQMYDNIYSRVIFMLYSLSKTNLHTEAQRLIAKDPNAASTACMKLLAKNKNNTYQEYTTKDNFSNNMYDLIINYLAVSLDQDRFVMIKNMQKFITGDARDIFQEKASAAVQNGTDFVRSTLTAMYDSQLALYTTTHFLRQCKLFLTNYLGGCLDKQLSLIAGERMRLHNEGLQQEIATLNLTSTADNALSKQFVCALIRKLDFILIKPNKCEMNSKNISTLLKQVLIVADYLGKTIIDLKFFGIADQQLMCSTIDVKISKFDDATWVLREINPAEPEAVIFTTSFQLENLYSIASYLMQNLISKTSTLVLAQGSEISELLMTPSFSVGTVKHLVMRRSFTPTSLCPPINLHSFSPNGRSKSENDLPTSVAGSRPNLKL